jgi:hypothetical protein
MKIFVSVKPKSKIKKIEKTNENQFYVWVKEAPIKGKANKAVIDLLAEYFKVPKNCIKIISGKSCRKKIIKIEK